jgi:hypothetical protein
MLYYRSSKNSNLGENVGVMDTFIASIYLRGMNDGNL